MGVHHSHIVAVVVVVVVEDTSFCYFGLHTLEKWVGA
jgi:hypothetical protein